MGIINRKGLGKTRHIDTGLLWVQEVAAEKRVKYGKVLGRDNPADLFTKSLSADVINKHMDKLIVNCEEGGASKAPTLSLKTWHRRDRNTTTMKLTGSTGPDWGKVVERITIDMADGKVIAREETQGRSKRWLKRSLNDLDAHVNGPPRRDILTILR